MHYTGEHLLPGVLGKSFIWLSFISLLASIVFYYLSTRKRDTIHKKLAGGFYLLHFAAVLSSIITLYYLIFNHYYEYSYVWQYSGNDLSWKFLLSCFWAGQEGSFLVWAFFQGMLGFLLMKRNNEWTSYLMPVYNTAQLFILSMVLGFKAGGFTLGGSPFELLREMPQNKGLDLFYEPDYIRYITDGNGLNPLLENIWMIIHPPALFLGYAVTMIPFSYAVASLWRKEYHKWLKPAIKWTIASALTLGFGILLGGRWAYESLTFGGFWAWDPVENASLVPWLLLIAALHMMLISSKRLQSYTTTYFFTILSWVFVVYATYLTRSGVLGATSVHSFGDSGKALQMLLFNLAYLIVPVLLLFARSKHFPKKDNELILSREFWMLVGSIVVLLSAFQITLTTSLPAINKLLGTSVAPPTDNIGYYNTWQLPFAAAIGLLIGISQYLWYGKNDVPLFIRKLFYAGAIAAAITLLITFADQINRADYIVLTYFTALAVVVSIHFLITYFRKTSNLGAAITHAGFGIFLLGVIIAFSNSKVITSNTSGISLGTFKDNAENVALVKGVSQPVGDYIATYSDVEEKGNHAYYRIDFVRMKDTASGKIAFTIHPSVNRNTRMGYVYNPDTRHFIDKDIYTYISFAQHSDGPADAEGFSKSGEKDLKKHDTAVFSRNYIILDSISAEMKNNDVSNASITAYLRILNMKYGRRIDTVVKYQLKNGELINNPTHIEPLNLKLKLEALSMKTSGIVLGVYEKKEDFIVIKTIVFPFMNILWAGSIIMFSGFIFAIYRRRKLNNDINEKPDPN